MTMRPLYFRVPDMEMAPFVVIARMKITSP